MRKEPGLHKATRMQVNSLKKQFLLVVIVVLVIVLISTSHAITPTVAIAIAFILGTAFIGIMQYRETLQIRELEDARLPNVVVSPTISPVIAVMSSDQEKSILNLGGVVNTGDVSDITGSTLLSQISGDVTNAINALPNSSEPNKLDIRELLTNLQAAIEASEELSAEAKADALEQVKVLAKAVQNPNPQERKNIARKAITFLMGTISLIPPVATLTEAFKTILPRITDWFSQN